MHSSSTRQARQSLAEGASRRCSWMASMAGVSSPVDRYCLMGSISLFLFVRAFPGPRPGHQFCIGVSSVISRILVTSWSSWKWGCKRITES